MALDPCGMVMDFVRSCYDTKMIFRVGDNPVSVRWHFAGEGAAKFPFVHSFGSNNWNGRNAPVGELGEQPVAEPWFRGTPLGRGATIYSCTGIDDWWLTGIPIGELAPPVDGEGIPLCCSAPAPCRCAGVILPDTLTAYIGFSGCPYVEGLGITLTRPGGGCFWTGTSGLYGIAGSITLTLRFAGPQPGAASLQTDVYYFPLHGKDTTFSADSSTCVPLALNFEGITAASVLLCGPFSVNISAT